MQLTGLKNLDFVPAPRCTAQCGILVSAKETQQIKLIKSAFSKEFPAIWPEALRETLFYHKLGVGSSVFLRLLSLSSPPSSSSSCSSSWWWLITPLTASAPRRETCLLVIVRPALSLGPQCLSGFGRNLATFLACALLSEATALAKLACPSWK